MDSPSLSEAALAPAQMSASDKTAEFEKFLDPEDEQDEQDTDPETDELSDEDMDEGEEADETEDEPDEPAIEAPASLNADEKKAFAAASPEAQQAWAAAETRRNAQVQEATTKAAERERAAETKAEQAEAQADQRRAAQLYQFISAFEPQMPDPQLARHDPASYIAAKAQYDAEHAQFVNYAQQIDALQLDAQNRTAQIDAQARVSDLMTVGKLADPAQRDDYLKSSLGLVEELGLDPKAFEEVASSADFKALEKVSDWKAKAAKYDQAMASKMQRVRQGKQRSNRPNAAPQNSRAAQGDRDWQRVKTAKSKEQQNEAFADYFGL